MSILNENYRNNMRDIVSFIIIVSICLNFILNIKNENIKYEKEKEVVCGFFESLSKYPRGGGRTTYILMLTLDKYGSIVYYNVNINKYDEDSKVDYSLLSKGRYVCFLIKKPKDEKNWNSSFRILSILEN